jgi:hypothetical protein
MHTALPGFGLSRIGQKGRLEGLLENASNLDSMTAQLVLREAYDEDYGIYDHSSEQGRPLALVGKHVKEDYHEYGGLYRAIYQFNVNEVHKNWGFTLTEFLDLPREFHRLILRICSEDAARSLIPTEKQIKQLEQNKQGKPK